MRENRHQRPCAAIAILLTHLRRQRSPRWAKEQWLHSAGHLSDDLLDGEMAGRLLPGLEPGAGCFDCPLKRAGYRRTWKIEGRHHIEALRTR